MKRDGQWYVRLPVDSPRVAHGQDTATPPPAGDLSPDGSGPSDGPLLDQLRAEVEYLRVELARTRDQAAEERRRHDEALSEERRLIAGLLAHLPELAAPSPSPSSTAPGKNVAPPAGAAIPEVPEPARKPWWRWWG